ncbi:AraC family transcriptional regulator [Sulfuriflexus mobilis]|uniref:AraC family transcriptional regulator n=1 Tax=Sulfuriflexus mobilis TaxID=1811807 RepID=UPI000F83C796|nr:AraC family transcriptional regulator [Sulfuriflexus mobilis]
MDDRLIELLNRFELRARVFQAGPLCHSASFDAQDGLGYIHFLRSGKLKVNSARQAAFLLEEPSLFFYMNPTSHHLFPQGSGVDMVCASFNFGAGLRNPLSQALPDVLVLKLSDMPALSATLNLLFTEAEEQHCGRQAVLDRLIEIIVIQLLRDLMDEKRLQIGLLAGLAEPKLAKAINAMHNEPARAWTLEDLANVAGMSRSRFAIKFRDTVGATPGSYLTEWRMGVAQSLLRRGKSVQLVADEVGYASASALSRAFVTQVGVSPTDWKKQYASER